MKKLFSLVVVLIFAPAVLQAQAVETKYKKWARCKKDSDCVMVKDFCGAPAPINEKATSEHEKFVQWVKKNARADCSNKDFHPGEIEARCIERECTLATRRALSNAALCEKWAQKNTIRFQQLNYCETDAECVAVSGGWPFGCYLLMNKQTDFKLVKKWIEDYQTKAYDMGCEIGRLENCRAEPDDLKCKEKKCVAPK